MAKTTSTRSKKKAAQPGKDQSGHLQNLEQIFELMEKHAVMELEWEHQGERLKVRTQFAAPENSLHPVGPGPGLYSSGHSVPQPDPGYRAEKVSLGLNGSGLLKAEESSPGPSKVPSTKANQKQVPSPFVGTFYRSSSPDSEPYVKEGQTVKRGDVLCIIEAMKLMNEIEAEIPGKIVNVLVENGQPVEYGEPLFIIES